MAIGRISGPMLYSNLERQGVDLAFESNVLYIDVNNRRIGANTDTPNAELQVVGTANIANITITANTIASVTGQVDFGSNANVYISGGAANQVLVTDGAGNLSWASTTSLGSTFGNVSITNNLITVSDANGNLELTGNGTGVVTTLGSDFYAANVVTGNVTANWISANVDAATVTATGNISAAYFIGAVDGVLITNNQPNINSVGVLTDLTVSGYGNIGNISIVDQTIAGLNLDADIVIAPLGAGNINANGAVVTNVGSPSAGTDAVNKSYVDGLIGAVTLSSISADDSFVTVFDDGMSPGNVVITTDGQDTAWFTQAGANIQNIEIVGNTIRSTSTDIVISANSQDANNIIRLSSVSAVQIPVGSDAQRPAVPETGDFRFNTTTGTIEWYTGTDWISGAKAINYQIITPDGLTATFTLDQSSPAEGILVNINGTVQQPGLAYTVDITETFITFAETPLITDIIEIRYLASSVVAAP